jgi:hypothetical protein
VGYGVATAYTMQPVWCTSRLSLSLSIFLLLLLIIIIIDDSAYLTSSATGLGWSNDILDTVPTPRANMAQYSYLTPAGCWRMILSGGEAGTQDYGIAYILPINPAWMDVQQCKCRRHHHRHCVHKIFLL